MLTTRSRCPRTLWLGYQNSNYSYSNIGYSPHLANVTPITMTSGHSKDQQGAFEGFTELCREQEHEEIQFSGQRSKTVRKQDLRKWVDAASIPEVLIVEACAYNDLVDGVSAQTPTPATSWLQQSHIA